MERAQYRTNRTGLITPIRRSANEMLLCERDLEVEEFEERDDVRIERCSSGSVEHPVRTSGKLVRNECG